MRLTLLLLLLVALPASAQDQGLRLVGVEQLPQPGQARIRAEVLDPALDQALGGSPAAQGFAVKLDDGTATVDSVRRAGDLGLRTHTVVAIDHSGSFKRWGYAEPAWAFVDAVAAAMDPSDSVSLQLFSESVTPFPVRSSAADLAPDLAAAKGADWGVITRLHNALIAAVDEVAAENPGGFNRIYVLTDGDEESTTWTWRDVATAAAAKGVQIHVVIYPPDMKRLSKDALGKLPTRLDDLVALATATGGAAFEHSVTDPAATLAIPGRWGVRGRSSLVIEADLCGMSRDSANNSAHLDYAPPGAPRAAWTDGFSFAEWGSAELFAPCPGSEPAQATSTAAPPAPAPPVAAAPAIPWWVWALVAALAVLLILAMILGARRSRTEVIVKPEPSVPPPVLAKPPDVSESASPPVMPVAKESSPALAESPLPWDLPRTFLEVVGGGQWLTDPRYAIFKRELSIGGDRSQGLDLFIEHPGVSGHHCTVQLFPRGDVWVRDETSSNGTFVDGVRIPSGGKCKVDIGSEVRLGSEIRFKLIRPRGPGSRPSGEVTGTSQPVPPASAEPVRRTPKKTRIVE